MTVEGVAASARPHSRGVICPSFAPTTCPPRKRREHRESRVRAAPAISCASLCKECAHEHTGPAEAFRLSLREWLTAYFVLSPVTGLFATVASRKSPRNLAPAPGRQDHTTSPSASATLVSRGFRVHRISPRVRDDRDPPLVSRKFGRMCERAVGQQPPVAGTEPAPPKGDRACMRARDSSGVFLNPNSCKGFEPAPSKEGSG
jgi:hypothetical protein